MRFILTLWIAKLTAIAVNLIDKKRGSNYAGKIALKLQKDFVKHFKGIDHDKVIFISGTNGKSTTTNLVYHTLKSGGISVASNTEGANMMGGVATTLIKNSSLLGRFKKDLLVLEIDERSFPLIRKVLPGRRMGLTNLQKDQVQRNGDPDFILRKFRGAIGKDMHLYLNNEEPRSLSLAACAGSSSTFSVAANSRSCRRDDFYGVTLPCPHCGSPISYDLYNLAGIGTFHCTGCDHRSAARPDVLIDSVDYEHNTFTCGGSTWTVPYNDPFYIYNFAMAIAICRDAGLTDQQIQAGFQSFKNPASHVDIIHYRGKQIHYLRGKQENPEALQSQLDIIAADPREKAVFVGLYPVADFDPHYCGSFYFFDCDFAPIVKSNVTHYVAFSTAVANDIASRMYLAGAPRDAITVFDTEDVHKIFPILDTIDTKVIYILTNPKHAPVIKGYLKEGN